MRRTILIILTLLSGCQKQYDEAACNDLSQKKFRGFTDAPKKFAENCQGFKIKYTVELCQTALNELIISNDLSDLKSKYGDQIENCFTEQDIKKFNKKS
ncbi:MAG: hypothetical protein K2P81_00910 [Bacteriovoracaceae bacterium]|nr:hypothetical protein [Bacteriovoracaceae bacterium]